MIKTFTPRDSFETPDQENHEENKEKQVLKGLKKSTIQNLLGFSKSLDVCETQQIGVQTMVMN